MKTKDRIKEEIGMNKLLMTVLSAISISLISWLWNNRLTIPLSELIFLGALFLFNTTLSVVSYFVTTSKIKKLDHYA